MIRVGELADRARFKLGHLAPVKPSRLRLGNGALSITFDDFPGSAWTEAGPVLAQHKVHATYFPSGGLCSTNYLGVDQFTPRYLEEVAEAGHEIGSHAFDHVSVLGQSPTAFAASLSRNVDFLKGILPGRKVESFAYPFGHVSLSAKLKVASEFRAGRGLGRAVNRGWVDLSQVEAVGLEKRQRRLHDLPALIEKAAQSRGWLVVYTHDVSHAPSDWGCTPEEIDDLVRHARQSGLDILPFGQVAANRIQEGP